MPSRLSALCQDCQLMSDPAVVEMSRSWVAGSGQWSVKDEPCFQLVLGTAAWQILCEERSRRDIEPIVEEAWFLVRKLFPER